MVLESLLTPKAAERSPLRVFLFGALYAAIGVGLAMALFGNQATMVLVFLTSFACIPLIYNTLKYEEKRDEKMKKDEMPTWKTHKKALIYFVVMSLGFLLVFSLFAILLPENTAQSLFSSQIETINEINNRATGGFMGFDDFINITINNVNVLIFCIFFSFFFGAGAIFILTWNMSVIAAAVGNFVRNKMASFADLVGAGFLASYLGTISLGFFRYMLHGIFEIAAYFIGGLAGGIISVAVIRHEIGSKMFSKVLRDGLYLFVMALILILVGSFIEVWITPLFF